MPLRAKMLTCQHLAVVIAILFTPKHGNHTDESRLFPSRGCFMVSGRLCIVYCFKGFFCDRVRSAHPFFRNKCRSFLWCICHFLFPSLENRWRTKSKPVPGRALCGLTHRCSLVFSWFFNFFKSVVLFPVVTGWKISDLCYCWKKVILIVTNIRHGHDVFYSVVRWYDEYYR